MACRELGGTKSSDFFGHDLVEHSIEWYRHSFLCDKIMSFFLLEIVYSNNAESRSLKRLFDAIRNGKI